MYNKEEKNIKRATVYLKPRNPEIIKKLHILMCNR